MALSNSYQLCVCERGHSISLSLRLLIYRIKNLGWMIHVPLALTILNIVIPTS
jgi:hypothetical protein